ncbi:MAG: HD domain-containing protein [Lachnospiraceae bacterium]|nr:HD domain-containing protein [Lachnospiraceae bacterium]
MRYIKDLKEGERVSCVYLSKHRISATTRNGKTYESLILQDKTGQVDGKIWEPDSPAIEDTSDLDYVAVNGEVVIYNSQPQLNIKRIRKASEDEYDPADYLPVSERNIDEMYNEVLSLSNTVKEPHLNALLKGFFVEDSEFITKLKRGSAAKSVHQAFVGGLLEHTINVARICEFLSTRYKDLDHDLLLTAALLHDIGKTEELSPFPENDYTDSGNMMGHIVIGTMMIDRKIDRIPDFPKLLKTELEHCILAHHGELEYGSPKVPAIIEAVALNFADNTDAKLTIFSEALSAAPGDMKWLGFNKLLSGNIRRTEV